MISIIPLAPRRATDRALATGTLSTGVLAALLSTAILLWRGRIDTRHAAAPINAISHWLWPDEATRRNRPTWKHTGTGMAVHMGSSLLWSTIYAWWRARRRFPTALNAATDAAALTAAAAVVDLALVPKRLTPGFEQRLSRPSLVTVYAGFALGLAVGGMLALRR
jgi:hypothetical protein